MKINAEFVRKLDLGKLTSKQYQPYLKEIGRVAQKMANAQYQWIKEAPKRGTTTTKGIAVTPSETWATRALERGGGKISFKGKTTYNEYLAEVSRAIKYIQMKTSSATGYSEYVKAQTGKLFEKDDDLVKHVWESLSLEESREFWAQMDEIKQTTEYMLLTTSNRVGSDVIIGTFFKAYYQGSNSTNWVEKFRQAYVKTYMGAKNYEQVFSDPASFITIED